MDIQASVFKSYNSRNITRQDFLTLQGKCFCGAFFYSSAPDLRQTQGRGTIINVEHSNVNIQILENFAFMTPLDCYTEILTSSP